MTSEREQEIRRQDRATYGGNVQHELLAALDSLRQEHERLKDQIGEQFGSEAKTCDDGSIQEDVLCAKVPELVKNLAAKLRQTVARQAATIGEYQEEFRLLKSEKEHLENKAQNLCAALHIIASGDDFEKDYLVDIALKALNDDEQGAE